MADVHGKEARSRNMSAIRQKNTKPEVWLRSQLHQRGYRFRIHVKELPGTPDIVLPKYKAVIFVHGCFWHRHGCYLFKLPQTRTKFWEEKLQKNIERDRKSYDLLRSVHWRVLTVWECSLKGKKRLAEDQLLSLIEEWLKSESPCAIIDTGGLSPSETD